MRTSIEQQAAFLVSRGWLTPDCDGTGDITATTSQDGLVVLTWTELTGDGARLRCEPTGLTRDEHAEALA